MRNKTGCEGKYFGITVMPVLSVLLEQSETASQNHGKVWRLQSQSQQAE